MNKWAKLSIVVFKLWRKKEIKKIILVYLEKLRGILPVTMDISFLFIITVFSKKLKLIKIANYKVALLLQCPIKFIKLCILNSSLSIVSLVAVFSYNMFFQMSF